MNNTLYTKLSTTVSTCRHGKCIVATALIRAGSLIFTLDGVDVKEPSKYTLQIAAKRHLDPLQSRWRFANHHCAPNAGIDLRQRAMVALRDIDPGAEVTFNYLTTEWNMSAPFRCDCGARHCPGVVAGYRYLSLRQRQAIEAIASDHVRRLGAAYARIEAVLPSPESVG